jgi:hypothetical protein
VQTFVAALDTGMPEAQICADGTRVVLADGRVALLRQLRPGDRAGVLALHRQLDQPDQYLRFFGPLPPMLADVVRGMTEPMDERHGSMGVFLAGAAGLIDAGEWGRRGMVLADLSDTTVSTLRSLLTETPSPTNPIQTNATEDSATFRRCVAAVLADSGVDAVIATAVRSANGDPIDALTELAPGEKPVLTVRLGQAENVTRLSGAGGAIETARYAELGDAVAVLGRLTAYAQWRRRSREPESLPPSCEIPRALALVRAHLRVAPAGGWLEPRGVRDLLESFGIPTGAPLSSAPLPGSSLLVRVSADGLFGPLVEIGLAAAGGEQTEHLSARLTPLTVADAAELLQGLPCSGELFGTDATPALDTAAVHQVLVRVSLLAQLLPEVVDLEINPLIVTSAGCQSAGARIRLAPSVVGDPFLPELRG